MAEKKKSYFFISFIVALGGFLMGFDASVISGVIKFVSIEFDLSPGQHGFAVASLTLTSTLAMLLSGPLSDRIGRKKVLIFAALLFFISAGFSALAGSYAQLVIARMIGGLGVGAALIIPPMYIAEIAPPNLRGRLVSFNQLNIVIGLSAAFFTNYLILKLGDSGAVWTQKLGIAEHNWRWMLSLEALPAILYFGLLFFVPESPRWLAMKAGKHAGEGEKIPLKELFSPALRLVLTIGIVVAVLQQITGINAVFFYAPMIFEQTGIGTDAAFANAVIIGLTNLVFTFVAIAFVDRLGRKPLLAIGLSGIIISMFLLAGCFKYAAYRIDEQSLTELRKHEAYGEFRGIEQLKGVEFSNDVDFKRQLGEIIDPRIVKKYEGDLLSAAISINAWLVLLGIIGFVASFAMSLGPVMWILFSELFPDRLRGLAISFVGVINSAISFSVQQLFPWELSALGSSATYFIYGVFAVAGLAFVLLRLPETRGKSLEELEQSLVK